MRFLLLISLLLGAACTPAESQLTLVTDDGKWQLSVSGDPQRLVIAEAGQEAPLRRYELTNTKGAPGEISCLFDAVSRQSIFAVLPGLGEIWEMSYDPNAKPVYPGFVHNFRIGQEEGIEAEPQPFARRRLNLKIDHSTLVFSPDFAEVIGRDKEGRIVVFNLDARRRAGLLSEEGHEELAMSRFTQSPDGALFELRSQSGDTRAFSTRNWRLADTGAGTNTGELPLYMCEQ